MLLSKEVEVTLKSKVIDYYETLGYKIPRRIDKKGRLTIPNGTKIKIKVEHLHEGSNIWVDVCCDYCGEKFQKKYFRYIEGNKNAIVKKDCCEKQECKMKKIKESNLLTYGVPHIAMTQGMGDKISKSKRHSFDIIKAEFDNRNYILLSKESDYKNNITKLKYVCKYHDEVIQEINFDHLKRGEGCYYCSLERRSGENAPNWQGGKTPLHAYLRDKLSIWKTNIMKQNNYSCLITGLASNHNYDIHHVLGFNIVLDKVLEELKIDLKESISEYDEAILKTLINKIVEKHDTVPGAFLHPDIHKIYHAHFGYGNNNPEQFELFKCNYYKGLYDNELEESLKSYNSIERLGKVV